MSLHKITCPSCNLIVSFTSEFGTSTTCVLHAAAPDLLAALEEIAKGEGAFSRDPLTHAGNVIEYAKETARAAIRKAAAS